MLRYLVTVWLLLIVPLLAWAQSPGRDVRLIVPYAPGGTVDTLARLLADALGPELGVGKIVVENRSGAGTFIGIGFAVTIAVAGNAVGIAPF